MEQVQVILAMKKEFHINKKTRLSPCFKGGNMGLKHIIKRYILNSYPESNECEMAGLNNIKLDTLIYSTNERKLGEWLDIFLDDDENDVQSVRRSKYSLMIVMTDGSVVKSVPPNSSARGYRYKKVVIDLDELKCDDTFDDIILPCGYACSRENVSFI